MIDDAHPQPSAPASRLASAASALGWVVVYLALSAGLQLLMDYPFDTDTPYHFAVGALLRKHGILQAFPWTPFSVLADHYADKELLFHALFVPLVPLGLVPASRILGTLLGALLLGTMHALLRSERVARAGFWPVVALLSSGMFMVRFSSVRPHLLSVTLALVVTWAASTRRWRWLAAAAFLYPFCYVAFGLAVALAVGVEIARALAGQRPDWRGPVVATVAMLAGAALHPNAANLFQFAWLVLRDVLVGSAWAQRPDIELGGEFNPLDPLGLLAHGLLPLAMACAAAVLSWRRRREAPLALTFALAALLFGALTLRTTRFVEYLAPFATVALALSIRDVPRPSLRLLAPVLVGLGAAWTGTVGHETVAFLGLSQDVFPPAVTERLRAIVPEGGRVFTCGWGTTGPLMVALPERQFLVALDPTLFFKKDPAAYQAWFDLTHKEGIADRATPIRERFGAGWAFCTHHNRYRPFYASMERDPSVTLALRTEFFTLYALRPPAPPPP